MRIRVPGDKSLTQRALIFSALADGESELSGLLFGGDAASTAQALRGLGADIPPLPRDGSAIRVSGLGLRGLSAPSEPLDLGNSGTGTRLLCGVLAGCDFVARLDGDASLRSRPMKRVTDPLEVMGARFTSEEEAGRLPLTVQGRVPLEPIDWSSTVASAQVKSAILLAGVTGGAFALVTEPARSRDHTERMLRAVGVPVVSHAVADGWRVELREAPERIDPLAFDIPGDISSAAFLLAFGALGGAGGELTVENVGLNPTRTGFLSVLRRMGAVIDVDEHSDGVEPVGAVTVRPSGLTGTVVEGSEIPAVIDELPLIAALGAVAEGVTEIRGAEELRAKESDRIHAMVYNLRALGAEVEELPDGLVVSGSDRALVGPVLPYHDHRIVMAFSVLAALPRHNIDVLAPSLADVSFPGFRELLHRVSTTS
ncbi:MAG: 3-phosphoshikimate 1-carboxyvinyltransferase [Gemmatimonadota bacterium]